MESTQLVQNLDFKIFEGPTFRQMPMLIAAGFVPASAAQIMQGRLEGKLSFNGHHDSGDAIIYHPDGRVKLVWDSQDLRKLDTESTLKNGALVLPAGAWGSIGGEEFSREEIKKYEGKAQSRSEVLANRFWQWLARDDKELLGEYAGQMLERMNERYGDDEAMRVYVSNPKLDVPALRLWCLGGVGNCNGGADGYIHLNYGHLVGVVAPEAPSAESACERVAQKNSGPYREPSYPKRPSLEETLAIVLPTAQRYVPGMLHGDLRKELTTKLSELYRNK